MRISVTMQLETLQDLYVHELKDLYSAEKQLIRALPKMAKAAKDSKLAAGFEEHLEQTKQHAARLERILSNHKKSTRGSRCKGMEGIIAEGAEMVEEEADPEVKDAGLISAAQRVEHYEIAGYGTARTYAGCWATMRERNCFRPRWGRGTDGSKTDQIGKVFD